LEPQTTPPQEATEPQETPHRLMLVGNIIDRHYYGMQKEIRRGTKQFRPGAKVYIFPYHGEETVTVIGQPRKSRRRIEIKMRSECIKNVRIKKVYDPYIVQKADEDHFYRWTVVNDPIALERYAETYNREHIELPDEVEVAAKTKEGPSV
jgi:hypothetical protein